MSRDDFIEKAAREHWEAWTAAGWRPSPSWEQLTEPDRRQLVDAMRAVVFPREQPPEQLPVGQVRMAPDGVAYQRMAGDEKPWLSLGARHRYGDADVRDWPVMIGEDDPRVMPEGHVAVDVSGVPSSSLRNWIKNRIHASGWFLENIARAELARRGERS